MFVNNLKLLFYQMKLKVLLLLTKELFKLCSRTALLKIIMNRKFLVIEMSLILFIQDIRISSLMKIQF